MEFCEDTGTDCQYQSFGRYTERCIRCSVENVQVAQWRRETVAIVRLNGLLGLGKDERIPIPAHPYLVPERGETSPRWSWREYKRACASKRA